MKDLRILFMGTPDFAVHILDHLIKNNHTISAVVTAPDKISGRGQKVRPSPVKHYALEHDLKVLQPTNLKADTFQQQLESIKPDVAVVVAFRMLPKKVWNFPPRGTFNLHASLLPDYRGAAPINWAIINGENTSGVTTFFLDEHIDTGQIIAQKEVGISAQDNAGDLHDKLMHQGALLVDKTLSLIAQNSATPSSQSTEVKPRQAPKLTKNNTKIDWTAGLNVIQNFIRGLSPYPAAWTNFKNDQKEYRVKIYATEIERADHSYLTGQVISTKKTLKVAVDSGFILIKEMQLPGKKKLPVDQLLNGFHLKENAEMR